MFRIIQNTNPEWVIAENVRGLVTWSEGMVLETVCSDLEKEGYQVQPFIIPAVSVDAPHRRDRVWIIAHASSERHGGRGSEECRVPERKLQSYQPEGSAIRSEDQGCGSDAPNASGPGLEVDRAGRYESEESGIPGFSEWARDWREVALATCNDRMDDGLSRQVGGVSYSFAKWRKEALKAYGNAIVPQVAMEIFRAIRSSR